MVGKVLGSIMVFFLIVSLEGSFGQEVAGNLPGQGSIGEAKNVGEEKEESKKKSSIWFRERFLLWETCHEELAAKLGENVKRDKAYLRRTISVLEELSEVLPEEQLPDLQTYIAEYKEIADVLKRSRMKPLEKKRVKQALDKLKGEIEKEFYYKVMEVEADLIERKKEIVDSEKVPRLAGVPPVGEKRYRYVAGRNSRTFHKVMCPYISNIKEETRVYFETKKEARESGRRLHRH